VRRLRQVDDAKELSEGQPVRFSNQAATFDHSSERTHESPNLREPLIVDEPRKEVQNGIRRDGWTYESYLTVVSGLRLLTLLVDLLSEVLCDNSLDLFVVHELGEQLLVLVHPVDEQIGEGIVEFKCEILL